MNLRGSTSMRSYSRDIDENRETTDLILGLDSKLFDSNPWIEEGNPTPLSENEVETNDQMFMQYNENLSQMMAKSILGDEYNPNGTNYKMCTDLTGTTITYDQPDGDEVTIKLSREEDAYIEPELREELLNDGKEHKQIPFLKIITIGALLVVVLATIMLIVVWKM